MCGRFAQSQTREEYLTYLAEEAERDIAYDPQPIGRYNVAPGTKVLLLSERNERLHLDPVHWGYAPGGGTNPRLLTLVPKPRPPAECLNRYGSMAGRFALPTVGSSGSVKAIKNNPT